MECKINILSGNEQVQKFVSQANIDFLTLKEKAYFTAMTEPQDDPFEESGSNSSLSFYQRRTDPQRVKEIINYLKETILESKKGRSVPVIFPTALLLAISYDEEDLFIGKEVDGGSILNTSAKLYIVDGQHRLQSMICLYESVCCSTSDEDRFIKDFLSKYIFNCTLFINYDIWEQAQIFASVNFNQKKVSKSLYFSIYGMKMDPSMNEKNSAIYVAHQLVKYINSNPISPLHNCVRMLGTGSGYVSQASVAESLISNIASPRGIWYVDFSDDKQSYRFMAVELISYLVAVKNVFRDIWPSGPKEHKSIICKTTGLGALLRLMSYIHGYHLSAETKSALLEKEEMGLCTDYIEDVESMLKKIYPFRHKLFGKKETGVYSGSGGKGLEANLFKDMRTIIRGEKIPDYLAD